jgi:biopolymer transport protein ExbD
MSFKRKQDIPIQEIELTPMLNVMMGILAFFVMITMTLGNQALVDLQLPGPEEEQALDIPPDPKNWFLVELNAKGQAQWQNQILSLEDLSLEAKSYLSQNSEGFVLLKPDRKLPYDQVMQAFSKLRQVGGDRVSLVID